MISTTLMVLTVIDLLWMNWPLMWAVYFCCVGFPPETGSRWGAVAGSPGSGETKPKLCQGRQGEGDADPGQRRTHCPGHRHR